MPSTLAWRGSKEYARAAEQNLGAHIEACDMRALVDFCNRVRAERRPEALHAT